MLISRSFQNGPENIRSSSCSPSTWNVSRSSLVPGRVTKPWDRHGIVMGSSWRYLWDFTICGDESMHLNPAVEAHVVDGKRLGLTMCVRGFSETQRDMERHLYGRFSSSINHPQGYQQFGDATSDSPKFTWGGPSKGQEAAIIHWRIC